MMKNLGDELEYVGVKMQLPWFTSELLDNFHFTKLVLSIKEKRKEDSFQSILRNMLPLAEYVASLKGVVLDRREGKRWLKIFTENADLIRVLACKHGIQEDVPQRGAIVLDYFEECRLFPSASATVVQFGCSGGLLGAVLCSSEELFLRSKGKLAKEYFWLKRVPRVRHSYKITHKGYDRTLPFSALAPWYVYDKEKRKKVSTFANSYTKKDEQSRGDFNDAFKAILEESFEPVIILTSFMLYQLEEPHTLVEKILNTVYRFGNVHWLDLSINSGIDCLFETHREPMHLVPDHVYLSHNGTPVAHVISGGEDCSDWEYLL